MTSMLDAAAARRCERERDSRARKWVRLERLQASAVADANQDNNCIYAIVPSRNVARTRVLNATVVSAEKRRRPRRRN